MRDEDLKNLPQTIERWRFAEMLEALGFGKDAQNNLRGFVVGVEGIKAVMYATDENGRKYFVRQMDHVEAVDLAEADPQLIESDFAREVALHEISIPFVGSWTKPYAEPDCTCPTPSDRRKPWHHMKACPRYANDGQHDSSV